MTSDATPSGTLRDTMRAGVRDVSGIWWWFLILGVLWTWFGMYVLSYRVGSLAAVAALVGVAFLFGGITQLALAVHRGRDPVGGRRDRHLCLARENAVYRGDLRGLVPDHLRRHARGRLAGRSQGAVVVDPAAARDRRGGSWSVGGPVLAAVAADAGDAGGGVGDLLRGERDLRRVLHPRGRQAGPAAGRLTLTGQAGQLSMAVRWHGPPGHRVEEAAHYRRVHARASGTEPDDVDGGAQDHVRRRPSHRLCWQRPGARRSD